MIAAAYSCSKLINFAHSLWLKNCLYKTEAFHAYLNDFLVFYDHRNAIYLLLVDVSDIAEIWCIFQPLIEC